MVDAEHPTYSYAIDEHDVMACVDDAWLDFAASNGAPALTRAAITGRSIWDFIVGAETREFYRRLFALVRRGTAPRSVPFRCDSPDRRRFMELELVTTPDSGIELTTTLLREADRVHCPLLDRALETADYSFPACSLCDRVFAFGSWLEVDEAVARLGAFDTSRPPGLEYGVCNPCRVQLELAETRAAAGT